jgi:hypothetical protein
MFCNRISRLERSGWLLAEDSYPQISPSRPFKSWMVYISPWNWQIQFSYALRSFHLTMLSDVYWESPHQRLVISLIRSGIADWIQNYRNRSPNLNCCDFLTSSRSSKKRPFAGISGTSYPERDLFRSLLGTLRSIPQTRFTFSESWSSSERIGDCTRLRNDASIAPKSFSLS